jgi:hypothetical protein
MCEFGERMVQGAERSRRREGRQGVAIFTLVCSKSRPLGSLLPCSDDLSCCLGGQPCCHILNHPNMRLPLLGTRRRRRSPSDNCRCDLLNCNAEPISSPGLRTKVSCAHCLALSIVCPSTGNSSVICSPCLCSAPSSRTQWLPTTRSC